MIWNGLSRPFQHGVSVLGWLIDGLGWVLGGVMAGWGGGCHRKSKLQRKLQGIATQQKAQKNNTLKTFQKNVKLLVKL